MAIPVSVLSAGRTALMTLTSMMMVLTATSPMLTVVELVRFTSVLTARSTAPSGTPSATKDSIMLAAASAPPIAPIK